MTRHFGNPGSGITNGQCEPDFIIQGEGSRRANKKSFLSSKWVVAGAFLAIAGTFWAIHLAPGSDSPDYTSKFNNDSQRNVSSSTKPSTNVINALTIMSTHMSPKRP